MSMRDIPADMDVKKIYYTAEFQRFVNYACGYMVDLPYDFVYNFDKSPVGIRAGNGRAEVTITREWSQGAASPYVNYFFNRFVLNERWRDENRVTLLQNENRWVGDFFVTVVTARVEEMPADLHDMYTYITIKNDTRIFYRLMFKYFSDMDFEEHIERAINSFVKFTPAGTHLFTNMEFEPHIPSYWSPATRALYDRIVYAPYLLWGIFTYDMFGEGMRTYIPEMEAQLDFTFDIILAYIHLNHDFPVDLVVQNYEAGRITQLTLQTTVNNNVYMYGYTPTLDIHRGLLDERIREIARGAVEAGVPFLFRLNNEMNTDWTSYSGIVNLSDPFVYINVWQRIYRIFREEGVDNAIWIWNPNDKNFPPNAWNNFIHYFPGAEYVHMLGITGYNTGTYYYVEHGEIWREFDVIMELIEEDYMPFFAAFPWIMTEFASSSIGGDKVAWIDNMFAIIGNYPNLRAAVWFSAADYDPRPEFYGRPTRLYWLDESPETLEAFRRGLQRQLELR